MRTRTCRSWTAPRSLRQKQMHMAEVPCAPTEAVAVICSGLRSGLGWPEVEEEEGVGVRRCVWEENAHQRLIEEVFHIVEILDVGEICALCHSSSQCCA
jgi:hypothetical protein